MQKLRAAITGIHGWVPDYILTNDELEKMVDTNDEWIMTRTGVKERRIMREPGKGTSDIGAPAVTGLLEKTGTSPEDIDLLICATVTPDYAFPATANIISDKCGLKNAWSFDINAACSGFVFALHTAAQFIEAGTHKKVIVVGAEKMSMMTDYTDRTTCVLFGDGAGAVLLEPTTEEFGIMDAIMKTDGIGRAFLHQKGGGAVKPASQETIDNRNIMFTRKASRSLNLPLSEWPIFPLRSWKEIISNRKILPGWSLTRPTCGSLMPQPGEWALPKKK